MSEIHMGGWSEEKYLLGYDKYVSNTRSNDYDDLLGSSSDKDVYHERPRMMRLRNILGKVTITALNALYLLSWPHLCWEDPWTVLPWLPILTAKPERVFDGTGIRVKAQIINKCRNKMTQGRIYNVRDPP